MAVAACKLQKPGAIAQPSRLGWLQAFGSTASAEPDQAGPKAGLDPNAFVAFPITEKEQLTHDTQRLRCGYAAAAVDPLPIK